ncbi:MurR/RpiR family transcriptional regulator [Priestia aryabhattai]|uniref:MurR/RpiR family transcriptional regulator n=1 Tax=Priestia aryabhattai TaxID=412384 RepID=UPI00203AE621|nr:MurR/RpiR family transcriptional regulator [Priestia aryabhattai]MCM3771743.1 MurR/RpiR family transcriptional regulator [Priestia aryabhattai]
MNTQTFQHLVKEKFSALSPGQKKVAEFLVSSLEEGALHTAFQIGREVGVSETTVIRLAYALGLNGFSDMQERIRQDWLGSKQSPSHPKEAAEKNNLSDTSMFTHTLQHEKQILDELIHQVEEEDIWQIVEALRQADQIYIGGFRESYTAAYWLYYKMSQLREHIYVSLPTGYLLETLCHFTEKSVVLVFSLPRYTKEAVALAEQAKKQGALVIAITDRRLSPVGQLADITLITGEQTEVFSDHILSLLSLSQLIITGLQKKDSENIQKRQEKLEQLYAEKGIFLE